MTQSYLLSSRLSLAGCGSQQARSGRRGEEKQNRRTRPSNSHATENTMAAVQDLPMPVLTAVALVIVTTVVILLLMKSKPALDPVEFTPFPLIKREEISHDTRRFTFAIPAGPNAKLGLPVGQHITLKFTETLEDGTTKNHQRSYTPVTGDDTPGSVTFVIKVYKAGVHPKFPAGGKMSQHLDSLKVGDTVDMRGPKGHLDYHKNGAFTIHPLRKRDPSEERKAKHIGMIAGGTGEEIIPGAQFCELRVHLIENLRDHANAANNARGSARRAELGRDCVIDLCKSIRGRHPRPKGS